MTWKDEKRKLNGRAQKGDALLITGISGFIGGHLVSRIENLGQRVFLIDKTMPKWHLKNSRLIFFQCDITKKSDVKKLKNIKGRINLIHLAACVPHIPSEEEKLRDSIFKVNIEGTINLLEGVKDRLDKVCYISTLEVYGIPASLPITETHPANPVSLYGLSKRCAEDYVKKFCLSNGIPYVILRFSAVYGPGENYDRAIPNFIKSAIKNKPISIYGDGSDIRDYLYVDDAITALLSSIKKKNIRGIFNIASGKEYKIKDIAKKIIKLCNSSSKIKFCDRRKKHYDVIFDISKARKELKFLPKTEIEEGLRKEIKWFRQR